MASPVPDSYTGQPGVLLLAGRPPRETHALAGDAAGRATAAGGISHHVPLAGAASGRVDATASLTVNGGVLLPQDPADITTFSLTDAIGGAAVPFTIGHAFKEGDIASGDAGVSLIGATAQVTPKNYWPDGSLKFAVISGTASLSAGIPATITVRRASPSTGSALTIADLKAAMSGQTCSIAAGAFGSVSWSGADFDSPTETWVSGHRMSAWKFRKPLGSSFELSAWVYIALYATGAVEVLPWVENGVVNKLRFDFARAHPVGAYIVALAADGQYHRYLCTVAGTTAGGTASALYSGASGQTVVDGTATFVEQGIAAPTSKSATYTFTLGSTSRFNQSISLLHHQRTPLIGSSSPAGGAETSYWLGAAHDVIVKHEPDYLQASNMVPAFFAKTTTPTTSETTLPSVFQPLSKCSFNTGDDMNLGGYRNQQGALPEWDVLYLTCGHASTYKGVVFNGYAFGRYNIHYREESAFNSGADQYKPARLYNHPGLGIRSPSFGWETPMASGGTEPPYWSLSHHPSAGYMAYLVTGNPYHLDTVQFAASADLLYRDSTTRQGGLGLFPSDASGNTRAMAWCLRTIAQAVAATPDSDTTLLTSEYRYVFGNNVTYNHDLYCVSSTDSNPVRFVRDSDYATSATEYFMAPWMQDYLTLALGHALDLKLGLSSPLTTKFSTFFHWHAPSVVGRFGFTGATEFLYRDGWPYAMATSPSKTPNFITGPFYANWGAVYDATFAVVGSPGARVEGPMRDWFNEGSPQTAAVAALATCVRHGATGAEAAWNRLTTSATWPQIVAEYDAQPGWAYGVRAMPKWLRGVAVNQWVELPGSGMYETAPNVTLVQSTTPDGSGSYTASGGGNSYTARLEAWGGMTVDTRRNTLWVVAAGGHGDYWNNELVCQDLSQDAPTWEIPFAGSNGAVIDRANPSSPRYLDGLPASRHTYYSTQFINRHGRAFAAAGGSVSPQGSGMGANDGFNVDATTGAGWSAPLAYPDSIYAGIEPAVCKDPTNEVIYAWDASTIYKFTPSTNGPTGSAGSGGTVAWFANSTVNNGKEGATAVDFTRNRMLWTHGYGSEQSPVGVPKLVDLATGTVTSSTPFTGAAAAALLAEGNGAAGMVYVPNIDSYLMQFGRAGAAVYKINASTLAVTMLSTSGGSGIPVCPGSGVGNRGVYNKWLFVPELRGVAYVPGGRSSSSPATIYNTWFLRLY